MTFFFYFFQRNYAKIYSTQQICVNLFYFKFFIVFRFCITGGQGCTYTVFLCYIRCWPFTLKIEFYNKNG